MESLEELYYELLVKKQKINPLAVKCALCFGLFCMSSSFPIFSLALLPSLRYELSLFYNLLLLFHNDIKMYKIDKLKSYEEYIVLNKSYQLLLKEIKSMLKKVEAKSPSEIFAIYYYIVRKGFLSINHTFYAENTDRSSFLRGTSILEGYGVCRNLSPLLVDILNECDYESYNIEMFLNESKIFRLSNDYYESIQKEENNTGVKHEIDKKFLLKLYSYMHNYQKYNHEVTLLANKDKSYILDPMNNTFYIIKDKKAYPHFCETESEKINLKQEFQTKRNIPKVSSENLNQEDIVKEYQNEREKCDDYFHTFQKFYLEHKELYEEIINRKKELEAQIEKIKQLSYGYSELTFHK